MYNRDINIKVRFLMGIIKLASTRITSKKSQDQQDVPYMLSIALEILWLIAQLIWRLLVTNPKATIPISLGIMIILTLGILSMICRCLLLVGKISLIVYRMLMIVLQTLLTVLLMTKKAIMKIITLMTKKLKRRRRRLVPTSGQIC
ncbi:hypothetical protein [Hyptis latent virus]|uniref:Uncharacterized protein n=1 Tax=Hyptis latent virus TaxID=2963947 RepID=A0AAE9SG47_9RHAB|nr:hypothetical protein [Hyptis latent virus]